MAKKKVTLSIDANIYYKYRQACKIEGRIISKQVERFMKEKLNKEKAKDG